MDHNREKNATVCMRKQHRHHDPRKNALLKDGNKNDRIDARKLAELLRDNQLSAV
jgi:hypothetical protein